MTLLLFHPLPNSNRVDEILTAFAGILVTLNQVAIDIPLLPNLYVGIVTH
jgi:hypothetical protein